jgi:hypothetical protein
VHRLVQKARHYPALAFAESRLAVAGKEFLDAAAGGALDFLIGIDEGQAELLGQAPADRAFARAHQADQHDGARRNEKGLRGAHDRRL